MSRHDFDRCAMAVPKSLLPQLKTDAGDCKMITAKCLNGIFICSGNRCGVADGSKDMVWAELPAAPVWMNASAAGV